MTQTLIVRIVILPLVTDYIINMMGSGNIFYLLVKIVV